MSTLQNPVCCPPLLSADCEYCQPGTVPERFKVTLGGFAVVADCPSCCQYCSELNGVFILERDNGNCRWCANFDFSCGPNNSFSICLTPFPADGFAMVELQITNLFTEDVYFTLGIASFPADCLSDLNGTYTKTKDFGICDSSGATCSVAVI